VETAFSTDGKPIRAAYTVGSLIKFVEVIQMATNKNIGKIVDLIFKAMALAMGVAVVVTNIMGVMDSRGQILLLGIGLFCLAITTLDKE
jgi:hypothetical protein